MEGSASDAQESSGVSGDDRLEISVVVPTYNRADSIERALNSLLDQITDSAFEVVVVDDGSTDDTVARIASLKSPQIRLVSQENQGASAARRKGIEMSRGSRIAFLDSDDVAKPCYLSTLSQLLDESTNACLAFAKVEVIGAEDDVESEHCVSILDDPLVELLKRGCFTASMNLLVRKDVALFASENRSHVHASNDYDFCLRAALCGEFVQSDRVTMAIDRREDGITSKSGHLQVANAVLSCCEAFHLSRRRDPALKAALKFRVRKLWPSAVVLCARKRAYLILIKVLVKAMRWGCFSDLRNVYWAWEFHRRGTR